MGDVAIRVENISKRYRIAAARYRHDTLRDQVMDGFRSMLHPRQRSRSTREIFWALRDVSFEVKQGEVVGIVGRNGAGKSTLLKILSRITEPSSGRAEIYGRVGSLLEVGTGFDQELTGLENIYLSGAILGMRKAEIDRKLDEIVAFSEVGQFIDTPVKRYSSGMYVRLAFAVAAHLEPEILIVDEVLAVGDAVFQRKCLGKMSDVAGEGRTVLFVSHNMAAITRLCRWGIWLDGGQLKDFGAAEEVVASYFAAGVQSLGELTFDERPAEAPGSEFIRLVAVRVRSSDGQVTTSIDARSSVGVEIEYEILRPAASLRVGFSLTAHDGTVVLSSTDADSHDGERTPGRHVSCGTIPGTFLNYGQYFLSIGSDTPMIQSHFFLDRALSFTVEQTGGLGAHISDGRQGLLRPALPWTTRRLAS
jgi:homopolymeric O-antigen transport system ATP-binding protein